MDIKGRIKDLCQKAGISINKLETELGFGTGYVSKLDKSTPNTKKIKLIADRFGVSVDYLMTGIEPSFGSETDFIVEYMNNSEMKDVIKKLSALKDTDKTLVFSLINSLYEKVEG